MKRKSMVFALAVSLLTAGLFIGVPLTHTAEFIDPFPIMVSDKLFLPYNVKSERWWTGLHIVPVTNSILPVVIEFYHGDNTDPYAEATLVIRGQAGWTGNVEDLLPERVPFRSPSSLNILSDKRFTVTKFIANTGSSSPGFGFQTFYSYSAFDGWPHSD